MSNPPDALRGIGFGIQSTPGTAVDPQHGTPVLQYRRGGFTVAGDPPVYVPPADPTWHPVPADPWAPAEPLAYRYSGVARERRALFDGPPGVVCPRCGTHFTDCAAVHVAPPGLPRIVVHLACLEAGDQVQPRPGEDGR